MKKQLLFILLVSLYVSGTKAQVASYLFSQDTVVYTETTGGTLLGDTASEDQYFTDASVPLGGSVQWGPGIPIGFPFTYNGDSVNVFGVSVNGWISVGNDTVIMNSSSPYFPLSSSTGGNFISALGRNLQAQDSSELSYTVTGTAPDRHLVIQWKNFRKHGNVNDHFNFQIQLIETENAIEFIYGDFISNINASFVQVGLTGDSTGDFTVRETIGGWQNTVSGISNTSTCALSNAVAPMSGLVFHWNAPPPCQSPPVPGITTATLTHVCQNTPFILTLSGNTSGPGQTYQWQESPDSINWTDITGANLEYLSTTLTASTWYRCELLCSGLYSWSQPILVSFNAPNLCYCTSTLGGDCAGYGSIDSLIIDATTLSNLGTGCEDLTAQNYSDYPPDSNTTATLMKGSTYTIHVTCTFEANISLWIDYNQSGTFDANEWTQVSAHANPFVISTATFTVPSTALWGTTKMRIRTRLYSATNGATDACTNFLSGETEDYTIQIDDATGVLESFSGNGLNVYPNPVSEKLHIINREPVYNYQVELTGICGNSVFMDEISGSSTHEQIYDLTGIPEGIYLLQIRSIAGMFVKRLIVIHE